MSGNLEQHEVGLQDEAAFEASLIGESDPRLEDTKILTSPGQAKPARTSPAAPAQPRWAGKRLGRYKLLRLLGEGTMGVVIQATDLNLRRSVALKVLRKRIAGLQEREGIRQFLEEARAAAQMEHPNIVRIYEIDQHDGWWYIAMELVEGETLTRVIKAVGPLSPERACPLIADAAAALTAMHEQGIIHRDVKPSNLMITRAGRGKMTDFGFVRKEQPDDPFGFGTRRAGTPQFMAPESLQPKEQTTAMDVYSLGATLYYALTGKPPYAGSSLSEIMRQHIQSPPPDLSLELPGCAESLVQLVRRAMAKDPAARPTAAEFAAALRAESIGWHPEDSGAAPGAGSSILSMASAARSTAGLQPAATGTTSAERPVGKPARRWIWLLLGAVVPVVAVCVLVWLATSRVDLRSRFPSAPPTYGVRPAGELPVDTGLSKPPAFSWVGKVDARGMRFAASRRGHFYWPINSTAAMLIRTEDFAGYATEAEARKDGKEPGQGTSAGTIGAR